MAPVSQLFGGQSMTGTLRRVLVRPPRAAGFATWREYGWRSEPDVAKLAAEHEAFCAALTAGGAEVVIAETRLPSDPDAIYVFDAAVISDRGAIVLRPGKEGRLAEADAIATDLDRAGVPVAVRLEAPATADGGDTMWLDESTLLVGRGYRTNDEGIRALQEALPGVNVLAFDLPHLHGSEVVLHLLSLLSPLDQGLVVAYVPLLPVRLVQLLREIETRIVEVPEAEFETMGPNVLALAPCVGLALEGNVETRKRLERAGVDIRIYRGDEISRKGDGGPTCLTRPLLRA
ncbi:MAG: dimethylargininase [Gaiellaceae bacterium]|nr:dimethylargininase [Gaiellaceae bacterium]